MAVGTVIGVVPARAVRMTAMPQMVALFNGVGGGAAALIAAAEYHRGRRPGPASRRAAHRHPLSAVVGSVSFWEPRRVREAAGALPGRPILAPAQNLTVALLGLTLLAAIALTAVTEEGIWLALLMLGAMIFGFLFVLADRRRGHAGRDLAPERVHGAGGRLNGLRAQQHGADHRRDARRRLGNPADHSHGQGDGASARLTLFGAFGGAPGRGAAATVAAVDGDGSVRTASADDIAFMLAYARRVVFVPGTGWRSPRHSTTSATSATCSRTRASTSATRSIRLPDGCPGT